jgi:hypothetical protein
MHAYGFTGSKSTGKPANRKTGVRESLAALVKSRNGRTVQSGRSYFKVQRLLFKVDG